MKREHFFILFVIFIVALVSCAGNQNVTLNNPKISEENRKYYELGKMHEDDENLQSRIFEISVPSTKKIQDLTLSLYKSSKDIKNWEKVNSFNMSLSGSNLMSLFVDREDNIFLVKIISKNGNTRLTFPLQINESNHSFLSSSILEKGSINITDEEIVFYSFILSGKQNISLNELGKIEDLKPTDENQFIITLRLIK